MQELNAIRSTYDPRKIYREDSLIAWVMDTLVNGTFADPEGKLKELYG